MSAITSLTYAYLGVQPSCGETKRAVEKVARKVNELIQKQGLPKTSLEEIDLVQKAFAVARFIPIDFLAVAYGQLNNAQQISDEKNKREAIKNAIRMYQYGEMVMNTQKKTGHAFTKTTEPFSAKVKQLIDQIDPDNTIQNEIHEEDDLWPFLRNVGITLGFMGGVMYTYTFLQKTVGGMIVSSLGLGPTIPAATWLAMQAYGAYSLVRNRQEGKMSNLVFFPALLITCSFIYSGVNSVINPAPIIPSTVA